VRTFSIFKLRIYDLVKLDEWRNELFSNHSLDLACSMLQSEIVYFIFPSNVFGQFIIDANSSIELLGKHSANLRFIDIYPKRLAVLLLILLLKQLIEIIKVDDFDLVDGLIEEMHEVFAPQHAAISVAQLVVKYLLKMRDVVQKINQSQLLELIAEGTVCLQKSKHLDVDVIKIWI
jgi:hypothetical protein